MKLTLNGEQQQLQSTVRALLADRSPLPRVRELIADPAGYDLALWKVLAELGILGLVVPEKFGGGGAGHIERAIALEEFGRCLAPTPFLASAVLATDALLAIGDEEAADDLLPGLASGELIGAVALVENRTGQWNSDADRTVAQRRDGQWELDGVKSFVLNGAQADVVLVYAGTPDGPGWFVVQPGTDGVSRTELTSLDLTRRLARLAFDGAPARSLTCADPAGAARVVGDLAAVALAAEQVGVLGRAVELTVDYAKTRIQFGRAIGSYQAVKHGCADMYSSWELALSVSRYAAWTADHNPAELGIAAGLAQSYIGPACFAAAAAMVQYHGGIGYTWEHDAHLYYKRAKSSELLLGPPTAQRLRLADRLGI